MPNSEPAGSGSRPAAAKSPPAPPWAARRSRVLGVVLLTTLPLLLLAVLSIWQGTGEARERAVADRLALARSAALTAGA